MKKIAFLLFLPLLFVTLSVNAQVERNHELLSSVLYNQTAGEFFMSCVQAYELAKVQLDRALADPNWTAATEQTGTYQNLPPAVALDVDETVLNNVPYEASLILLDGEFTDPSWDIWVHDKSAEAIPGALEFCRYAHSKGVKVFYVTNRTAAQEPATLINLKMLGFPVDDAGEALMSSKEIAEWGSDKITRRAHIAKNYRLLLLVGDDMNDFVTGTRANTDARNAAALAHKDKFGTKWITIPNDMYGGWEAGIFNRDYTKTREEKLLLKYQALKPFAAWTPVGSWTRKPGQNHELLSAVLWYQTAAEAVAVCKQSYELAKIRLDQALAKTDWSAVPEQTGSFASKQPAVILDCDETVIDNSEYEASLILLNSQFANDTWDTWVKAKKATAIPGAVEFCQYAASKGVKVYYVTNRSADQQQATLENMKALGFPIDDAGEYLLCNNELPAWGSDKKTRRAAVAENNRILVVVGDDLNDFVTGTRSDIATRNSVAHQYKAWMGTKWIILPNSMYGGWEAAIFKRDYSLNRQQVLDIKYKSVRVFQNILPSSVFSFDQLY